ncbi:MAG: FAD-dependent oxidoreductase, partial [Actinomycetes bacterium]
CNVDPVPRYKIAIVGAGPAGYFTAQALQNAQNDDLSFSIDLFERLPTMWGLVRSGVAPDHPKIKTVAKVFEKIASEPDFRLFGNVEVGTDLDIEELCPRYDAVVMCTGSSIGKTLGIPGEDLPGSLSAAEFVPWYNGHPDYVNVSVPLDGDTAVIIGAGNVAMDCARMLALNPIELDPTDTAEHALAALHASGIRKVYIAGRRGPEHAAFTAPELRELPKLEHTDVIIDNSAVQEANERAQAAGEIDKQLASNLEAWRLIAEKPLEGHERVMEFRFLSAPKEIKGIDRVEEVVFGINEIKGGKVVDTGETYSIKTNLVITAIGYHALPIKGISFRDGKVENDEGRVLGTNIYTVGWAKRGPSGVIGTNKSDASDVVKLLIEDLGPEPKNGGDISVVIPQAIKVIDQAGWMKINAAEVAAGEATGKPRLKEVDIAKLISLAE